MPRGIGIVAGHTMVSVAEYIAKKLKEKYSDVRVIEHSTEAAASLDGAIVLLDYLAEKSSEHGLLKELTRREIPVLLLIEPSRLEKEKKHIFRDGVVGIYGFGSEYVQDYEAIINRIYSNIER